jgi:hypothetical protein
MKKEGSKFRPLTVVLPIEKIMKEAIRMVPESIYDPEFPDTSVEAATRPSDGSKKSGEPLAGFWNSTSGSVFTPSTDIDSSQS